MMLDRSKYVIWWLDQYEMEDAEQHAELPPLPAYLQRQWDSRHGRAGRGRLWIDDEEFTGDEQKIGVDPWPKTPVGRVLKKCGGIVMRVEDLSSLQTMPGLVTDLDLVPLRNPSFGPPYGQKAEDAEPPEA